MGNRDILSIDIGTTSVKAAVIDADGNLLSYAKKHIPAGSSEQLAHQWASYLRVLLPGLSGISAVQAVSVTGNGPTLVALDRELKPCAPVISWARTPSADIGDHPSLYLPKVKYALTHRNQEYERTHWFVGCPEYISFLLCGELSTFVPENRFIPYIWDEKQLEATGLSGYRFPQFIETAEPLGFVTDEASGIYGIPSGIPVAAGMTDFHAALLGCACVHEGMTCDRAGTSEGINFISDHEAYYEHLRTLPSIIPGTWTVAGLMPASGEVFEWYRHTWGVSEEPYDQLMSGITSASHSRTSFFYPHLRRKDSVLSGGDFVGIREDEDSLFVRGRIVAEGIGFTVRSFIDGLRSQGCEVDSIRHCGGQARSPWWNELKAQLLQTPVEVPALADAELLGCAAAARTALGDYGNLTEAAEDLVAIEAVYYPYAEESRHYDELYDHWLDHRNPD
jgi:xylulokinase